MDFGKQLNKFQFVEQNSVECWCDLGANLVQHFTQRDKRLCHGRAFCFRFVGRGLAPAVSFGTIEDACAYGVGRGDPSPTEMK